MNRNALIEEWEIEMPDGTMIRDEIEYVYKLSEIGVELTPERNRRIVTFSDGEESVIPVPENFEQNRKDLHKIISDWNDAVRVHESKLEKRENNYMIYSNWIEQYLDGKSFAKMLFSNAPVRTKTQKDMMHADS